jgi:hypothetical protein
MSEIIEEWPATQALPKRSLTRCPQCGTWSAVDRCPQCGVHRTSADSHQSDDTEDVEIDIGAI